ncbi:MAG: hypothetical protein WBQ89_20285, partial [Candidatus Acidiferrum sp.]
KERAASYGCRLQYSYTLSDVPRPAAVAQVIEKRRKAREKSREAWGASGVEEGALAITEGPAKDRGS